MLTDWIPRWDEVSVWLSLSLKFTNIGSNDKNICARPINLPNRTTFDSLYCQIQNFRCVSWRSCKAFYNELFIKVNNWSMLFKDKSCSTLPQPIVNVKAAKVLHGWAEFVVFWQLQSMVWCVMCDVCLLESILEMCSSSGLSNLSEPALLEQAPRSFARDQDLILQVYFK